MRDDSNLTSHKTKQNKTKKTTKKGYDAATRQHTLRYDDADRHQRRAMRLVTEGSKQRVDAFLMAGNVQAEAWVRPLLQDDQSVESLGARLLSAGKQAPGEVASRGKQVCTCFNVSDTQILSFLPRCNGAADQRLAQLQVELKCGTNCGSCLPALRQQVQRIQPVAQTV